MDNYWDWLTQARETRDNNNLTVGMVVSRMRSQAAYGDGAVLDYAKDTSWSETTLWEYARVYRFAQQLCKVGVLDTTPRHIFSKYPVLSYTHLRIASSLDDFEDACEAIGEALDTAMTSKQFGAWVKETYKGKPPIGKPIYDQAGKGMDLFSSIRQHIPTWVNKQLRLKIWEVD